MKNLKEQGSQREFIKKCMILLELKHNNSAKHIILRFMIRIAERREYIGA